MRVLVTGGAGFVGTNLVKRLVNEGHKVYSIDNYSTGLENNHVKGCKYTNADVNEICDEFLTNGPTIDFVFHMAAKARIQPSFEVPEKYIESNFQGTYEVVKYCIDREIPLIYAGSSSHHSGKFKNPYTFSKDLGEDIIRLYQTHFGLKCATARFYNVYGPNQLMEGGYTTLIGKWLYNMQNGLDCTIYGDGSKRRDFTHVDDIVDGLIKMKKWLHTVNKPGTSSESFEFGRGENHSINEVAEALGVTPIYENDKPGEAQDTLANYTFAKEELDWNPKLNLTDYLQQFSNKKSDEELDEII